VKLKNDDNLMEEEETKQQEEPQFCPSYPPLPKLKLEDILNENWVIFPVSIVQVKASYYGYGSQRMHLLSRLFMFKKDQSMITVHNHLYLLMHKVIGLEGNEKPKEFYES